MLLIPKSETAALYVEVTRRISWTRTRRPSQDGTLSCRWGFLLKRYISKECQASVGELLLLHIQMQSCRFFILIFQDRACMMKSEIAKLGSSPGEEAVSDRCPKKGRQQVSGCDWRTGKIQSKLCVILKIKGIVLKQYARESNFPIHFWLLSIVSKQ